MIKSTLLIALSLFWLSAFTQKDEKAVKLLEEVSAKTKASKSIQADFSYSMDNKNAGIHETKTGTLLVAGDQYKLTAAGQTVFCDGKTVWTYIGESNEVQVNDIDLREDALTPSKLLTSYNANYQSRIIQDPDAADPSLEAVELTPNTTKNFNKAILIVNKTLKQITAFKIFDKNGNIFTYRVKRFLTDVPVKDSDFIFDEANFPDVEIIDMR